MEAAVVAEAERDAGLRGRRDGRVGVGLRQREGLLAEDVLPGLRRRDHLLGVLRVRRRQDDRVDVRVREQCVEVLREGQLSAPRRTP